MDVCVDLGISLQFSDMQIMYKGGKINYVLCIVGKSGSISPLKSKYIFPSLTGMPAVSFVIYVLIKLLLEFGILENEV